MGVTIEFCGERFIADPERPLTIGRSGDVEIDDNPYLHRTFLHVVEEGGLWWLANVGSTLTATVADQKGLFQAWLSPGARVPLALERFTVWFTAGPTTYDFEIVVDAPAFASVARTWTRTTAPERPRWAGCPSPRTRSCSWLRSARAS